MAEVDPRSRLRVMQPAGSRGGGSNTGRLACAFRPEERRDERSGIHKKGNRQPSRERMGGDSLFSGIVAPRCGSVLDGSRPRNIPRNRSRDRSIHGGYRCHRLEPREPLRPCFPLHAQGGAMCSPVNSFSRITAWRPFPGDQCPHEAIGIKNDPHGSGPRLRHTFQRNVSQRKSALGMAASALTQVARDNRGDVRTRRNKEDGDGAE